MVVLEKVIDDGRSVPKGTVYPWSYKATSDMNALARAVAALKRDHPRENPANWKTVK